MTKPVRGVDIRKGTAEPFVGRYDTHLDNRWVLLAPLCEFFKCQSGVFIAVHISENLVDSLMQHAHHQRVK